jgi:hypothetical protein
MDYLIKKEGFINKPAVKLNEPIQNPIVTPPPDKNATPYYQKINTTAEKYKGWIVKTIGDAFMVYFEKSEDSLFNAIKFSKEVILSEKSYNLRVGVCQGHMDQKTYRLQKFDLKDFLEMLLIRLLVWNQKWLNSEELLLFVLLVKLVIKWVRSNL